MAKAKHKEKLRKDMAPFIFLLILLVLLLIISNFLPSVQRVGKAHWFFDAQKDLTRFPEQFMIETSPNQVEFTGKIVAPPGYATVAAKLQDLMLRKACKILKEQDPTANCVDDQGSPITGMFAAPMPSYSLNSITGYQIIGGGIPLILECNDGIDNDGDGDIDYPNDGGCTSSFDTDETNCGDGVCEPGENCFVDCVSFAPASTECSDAIDNDGDGVIDLADTGCTSGLDTDETNCGDGVCEGGETGTTCSADCLQIQAAPGPVSGFPIYLGPGDIIMDLKFDSGTDPEPDASGNNHDAAHGTSPPPAWAPDQGVSNGVYIFAYARGVDDYLEVADHSQFNIPTSAQRSFECFVKVGSDIGKEQYCMAQNDGVHTFALGIDSNLHGLFIIRGAQNTPVYAIVTGTTDIVTDGEWHHLIAVKEVDTGTTKLKLYVDGVLEGTAQASIGDVAVNDPLIIGNKFNRGQQFDGAVDEVRIYNKALSITEVQERTALIYEPMALLHLNDNNANTDDSSENAIEAIVNGATLISNGRTFRAYAFDGIDDDIQLPWDTTNPFKPLDSDGMTLECFIRTKGTGAAQYCMGQYDSVSGGFYGLGVGGSNNKKAKFTMSGATVVSVTSGSNVADGHWHHIVGVMKQIDPSTKELKIYVDGQSDASPVQTTSTVGCCGETFRLFVGQLGSGATSGNFFNGALDEVAYYPHVLSDPEILARSKMVRNDILMDFTFSNNLATEPDASGNNNDGAKTGSPIFTTSGLSGSAYVFHDDGVDDFFSVASSSDSFFRVDQPLSLECFAKFDSVSSARQYCIKQDVSSPLHNFFLGVERGAVAGSWQPLFALRGSSGSWHTLLGTTDVVTDGEWHHLVGVKEHADANGITKLKIYVDGVLENSALVDVGDINGNSLTIIGNRLTGLSVLDGTEDEVRIYARPMTLAEVVSRNSLRCGDGTCGHLESPSNCAADCPLNSCPNNVCDPAEDPSTCSADCPSGVCGNHVCDPNEDPSACASDCPSGACGNNVCDPAENPTTCSQDCQASVCGNNACESGEDTANCYVDCHCGDNFCDTFYPEDPASCGSDCATEPSCDPTDIIALYHFNENPAFGEITIGGATLINDFSVNDNYGLCSDPQCPSHLPIGGKFKGAYNYDGTDDHFKINNFQLNKKTGTVEAWVKPAPRFNGGPTGFKMIVWGGDSNGDGFGQHDEIHLYYDYENSAHKFGFFVEGIEPPFDCGDAVCGIGEDSANCVVDCPASVVCGDVACDINNGEDSVTCPSDCTVPSADCDIKSVNQFQPGQWYHVVGTYKYGDGVIDHCELYVNGVLENEMDFANHDDTGWANYVRIGRPDNYQVFPDRNWKGEIDEMIIYNRVLTAQEIAARAGFETAISPPEEKCPVTCGDNTCSQNENPTNCVVDCPTNFCPNNACDQGEDSNTCPQDCPVLCNDDGTCDPTENPSTCSSDCPQNTCPNNVCEAGEDSNNCPTDCPPDVCGDGMCGLTEDQASCAQDCVDIIIIPPGVIPPDDATIDPVNDDLIMLGNCADNILIAGIDCARLLPGKAFLNLNRLPALQFVMAGAEIADVDRAIDVLDKLILYGAMGDYVTIFGNDDFLSVGFINALSNLQYTVVYYLNQGLNLVSLPHTLTANAISGVFAPVINNVDRIFFYDPAHPGQVKFRVFNSDQTKPQDLNTFGVPVTSYYVKMDSAADLMIKNLANAPAIKQGVVGWQSFSVYGEDVKRFNNIFSNQNAVGSLQCYRNSQFEEVNIAQDPDKLIFPGEGCFILLNIGVPLS